MIAATNNRSGIMTTTITSNIYRADGEWCHATSINGEHDDSDTLGLDDDATAKEAAAAVRELYSHLDGEHKVNRVDDIGAGA